MRKTKTVGIALKKKKVKDTLLHQSRLKVTAWVVSIIALFNNDSKDGISVVLLVKHLPSD